MNREGHNLVKEIFVIFLTAMIFFVAGLYLAVDAGEISEETTVSLTAEERAYIKEHPEVSIAIDTSWIPYGFSRKDDTVAGVIPDILKMIADRTGLNVKCVNKPSYIDAITACNTGETMLVSGIANDPEMSEKNKVNITDPYITISYSAVTKREVEDLYVSGANYKVAICVGTYAKMAMERQMPSYSFVEYHSNKECMDAVLRDEADIALIANYSVSYYSNWHEYSKLQTIPINDFSWGLCFGVNKDCDPMLIEILNKGIQSLTENDINQSIYTGAVEASKSTSRWIDALYEKPQMAAVTAAVIVAFLVIVLFSYILQKRKIKELHKEKELLEDIHQKDLLLNSIPTGIGVFEIIKGEVRVRYLNDSFYRLVGDTRENRNAWTKQNFMDGILAEDYCLVKKAVEELSKGKQHTEFTYRAIRADGSYAWIHLIALVTLRDEEKITVYGGMSCVDEEVKTRQELLESVKIIDAAMHSAKMTVWSYDCQKKRIYQSRDALIQNGMGEIVENVPESLIESGYIHPDSAAAYRELYDSLPAAKKPVQGDFLAHIPDGDGYWWERLILTPIYENDVLVRAIGTSINVTVRKEKESKYLKLVEQMTEVDDGNLIAKGRHNLTRNAILYYERKGENGLPLSKNGTYDDALLLMIKTAVCTPEGEAIHRLFDRHNLLADFANGKTEGSFEYKRFHSDGMPIWSLLKYTLLEEPSTEDIIIFIYAYDVSERILQNHILSKLGTLEHESLCLLDVATHRYSLKNTMEKMGSAACEPDGDYDEVLLTQIIRATMLEEQEKLKKQLSIDTIIEELKKQDSYYVTYSEANGEDSWKRKRCCFSYLDASQTTILFYRTDITKTYLREQQQLLRTEEALETAKQASSAKTEFFSRMSHDMRTPMNGILGMARLSEEENDIAVLKQNINKIEESGKYLLGLINDTLDFQKIESGKLKLIPEIVDSMELLDSITSMVKTTAENKGVSFQVITKNVDLHCFVRVDPMRMKQIFINLLSNAVKFTETGGSVELHMECLGREGMISHDRFLIIDTGIGMSKEFLKNGIFKPFSQEYNVTTSNFAGTGLGLSIVKQLVELMNGTIAVESEQGTGSTFTVNLDFERVGEEETRKYVSSVQKRRGHANSLLHHKNILLAEDHPLNAEIAKRLLEKTECNVIWVKDGKECVDVFAASAKNQYDVILMDIRMPILDGLEATRQIRSMERADSKTIPIIAMTANAYEEDVRQSLNAGMNAHISKPIDPLLMYEVIMGLLKKNSGVGNKET